MTKALSTYFAQPAFALVALGALAAALLLALHHRRRSSRRADALVAPALAAKGLAPAGSGLSPTGVVLVLIAVLGTGAALARPRWGRITEKTERKGADVVLLLDTSASMRATDVTPNRFVLARQAAASLLARLAGDRVALVACEGEAQALVPLTLDTSAAGLFLDALEPGIGTKPGTSLAAGIASAAELFSAAAGGKHAVIISDGEDLEGGVDEAVEKAKAEGIVLHTVFVGQTTGSGAPVPDIDAAGRVTGYKSQDGSPVLSKPDPDLLKKLAARTGGSFSVVSPGHTDLDGVAKAIAASDQRKLSETLVTNLEERFQVPLGVAVGAIGLLLLGAASFRLPARARTAVRSAAAGLVGLTVLATGTAGAQGTAPAGVPSAPAPAAVPGPAPTPASLVERIAARPPFTTARSEAEKGVAALGAKNVPEAVTHFAREAELAPQDPTGAYNLGTALSLAGKPAEAVASLEAARKAGRRDLAADAAFNIGTTRFREKEYEQAARAFREALRLSPGNPDASWNYELCVRRAEEEKKKQQQQQQKQDQDKEDQKKKPQPSPSPSPSPSAGDKKQEQQKKQEREDREFEEKAKMSREKAEQLLAAISNADREEQKKRIAEQKSRRKVARDW